MPLDMLCAMLAAVAGCRQAGTAVDPMICTRAPGQLSAALVHHPVTSCGSMQMQLCSDQSLFTSLQVQQGCIPAVLAGRDVIGTAHTGSGKTAAFALPILQKLAADPFGVFALVLTPTRQAAASCRWESRSALHLGIGRQ